jgi:hypothetical protein
MQTILDFITQHWESFIAPLITYEIGTRLDKKKSSIITGIIALVGMILKTRKKK